MFSHISVTAAELHSYMAFFLCIWITDICIVNGMVSVVWSITWLMCIRWGMNGLLISLCMSVNEDVFILLCGKRFISFHSQKPIREQREWHSIPEEYLITQRILFHESLSSCRSKLTFFLSVEHKTWYFELLLTNTDIQTAFLQKVFL